LEISRPRQAGGLVRPKGVFFAPPGELDDPFEGYLPRSHVKAHEEIAANIVAQLKSDRDKLLSHFPGRDRSLIDAPWRKPRRK